MDLDIYQEQIVNATDKKIICIAPSGSGKTRVLTERIRAIIERGAQPEGIVAITFTNAAAEEMRERLPEFTQNCFIGTIHSYANRLLTSNHIKTGKVISEDRFDLLFDLINQHLDILPHVTHLLVDEFQDVSRKQYDFFKQLNADNYFFVMDDYQAIFDFDPIDPGDVNIGLDLTEEDGWVTYFLKNNYRSGTDILRFAGKFVQKLSRKLDKVVKPCVRYEGKVEIRGKFSLANILNDLKTDPNYKNWFVLVRTNREIYQIMNYLKKHGIDCLTFKKADLDKKGLKQVMEKNAVKVLTIHSSKGLENENVIVRAFSINLFGERDTNCRLLYVAATRAKKRLIWYV